MGGGAWCVVFGVCVCGGFMLFFLIFCGVVVGW